MTQTVPQSKATPRISTLVADSNRMSAQLLSDVLNRDHQIEVVYTAVGYSEALSAVATQNIDVALISAELDGDRQKGLELCRALSSSFPHVRVVVLLESSRNDSVVPAFRAGARGVFFRDDSVRPLAKCIHSVHHGEIWASSREMNFLLAAFVASAFSWAIKPEGMPQLTRREDQVVHCVSKGLTNREIAGQLKLSEHTIKNYVFRIFEKLGISNRIELVVYALGQLAPAGGLNGSGANGSAGNDVTANWYRDAAQRGCGVIQYGLGEKYRDGVGVSQDKLSAYVWFSLAERDCSDVRKRSKTAKRSLAAHMTGEQIHEAERRASELFVKRRTQLESTSAKPPAGTATWLPEASGM